MTRLAIIKHSSGSNEVTRIHTIQGPKRWLIQSNIYWEHAGFVFCSCLLSKGTVWRATSSYEQRHAIIWLRMWFNTHACVQWGVYCGKMSVSLFSLCISICIYIYNVCGHNRVCRKWQLICLGSQSSFGSKTSNQIFKSVWLETNIHIEKEALFRNWFVLTVITHQM